VKQGCVSEQFLLRSMITQKCLPGILNQTEGEGKRARQRRDRERVCVRGRALWRDRDGIGNKIDH
jgi:hypothetical protein